MIDIHAHIIPNVDDGSKSVEETFNILKEAENVGFTDIILTSHYLINYYETDSQELVFWKDKLQEVLDKCKINIKLHSGMEIYASDQIKNLILENKLLTLADSKYILIELPMSSEVKYLEHIIYILKSFNLVPVIAHPERYKYVQKNIELVEEYIEMGCLIQCNYGSILDLYGKEAKNTLKNLLKKNIVHFLGSDCHNQNTIYKIIPNAIKKIKRIIGDKNFYKISTLNPKKILQNEDIDN